MSLAEGEGVAELRTYLPVPPGLEGGGPSLADDGVAPDESAGDGVFTALVTVADPSYRYPFAAPGSYDLHDDVVMQDDRACNLQASTPEVMAVLRDMGFRTGIVTNGWRVDEATARRLAAVGLRTATVSVDGLAATHDLLRGKRGACERALSALERLDAQPGVSVEAITCVSRYAPADGMSSRRRALR